MSTEDHPTSNSDPFRRTTRNAAKPTTYIPPLSQVAFKNIIDTSKWPAPEPLGSIYGEGLGIDAIAAQLDIKT